MSIKSEIWDLDKARKVAETSDISEFAVYGNNQLYLYLKLDNGDTEYVLLMPGWAVRIRP